MRKQRSPWTKKQQLIFGIIVIVVTLIASVTAILIVATKPYVDAEKKVIAIAESKADIKTVTEFDIYHGESTYYGLLGKSSQGEKLAVIMVLIQVWLISTSNLMVLVSQWLRKLLRPMVLRRYPMST